MIRGSGTDEGKDEEEGQQAPKEGESDAAAANFW